MDELLTQFLIEGRELVAEAQAHLHGLLDDPADASRIDGAFRAFHTLKGSVALFDMAPAGRILHAGEGLLDHARAGTLRLSAASLAALVDTIDTIDRWIDALEAEGHLPAEAERLAARIVTHLAGGDVAAVAPADTGDTAEALAWLDDLLANAAGITETIEQPLTAFRYEPDAGCFFRGDDPLRLVTGLPDILALRVLSPSPLPVLADMAPFDCVIAIEGLSTAPGEAIRDALRVAGDQVDIRAVPMRRREQVATGLSSIRIDAARLDAIGDDVGEFSRIGHELAEVTEAIGRMDAVLGARMRSVQAEFERGLGMLHRDVTMARRVGLGPTLRRLPRLVRELAAELGREVVFTMEGEATEVDKTIADMLYEPLLHLVRNAIDHGIEPPDRRRALGKTGAGHLQLTVRRAGETVVVTVSDDGRGIDPARIRSAAIERSFLQAEAVTDLDDRAALQLLFAPGFSTAAQVTQISGRGVGLDAVKSAVEAAGGHVAIESLLGRGTTTTLSLPLNAITTRLLVIHVGGDRYGVPFHSIVETAYATSDRIRAVGDGQAIAFRDRTLPVVHLASLLSAAPVGAGDARLLIVDADGERVAVAVDAFGTQIEAMVRPPGRLLAGMPAIAGTTILGDGDVLLVLDPARFVT